ncbi:GNAT family N-acetyltransferase [Azomonas macrocytogenes]|uniref:Ribosomal protein S18 acetylase RimI-like enzyme n=1 Tax=Azomonas macrocytogenes TaxID=69962 RepID=A0A839T0P4_AZOMA|nr:GNAT family N-acetyltransferase [Azomonas macrocytogenes]MBB3102559.1 ribosomal protein S18 acetylase RimI-like enzyme [Azomonas macrocytogenes]
MVHIREKTINDSAAVAEVITLATADLRRVYRPVSKPMKRAILEEKYISKMLVAVDGELIFGVAEYYTKPDSLYIQGLATHPQHRRRGIAQALINAVEEIAIRENKPKLTLSTIKETGNSQIFARLGFIVVNEVRAEEFEGIDGQNVIKVEMVRIRGCST